MRGIVGNSEEYFWWLREQGTEFRGTGELSQSEFREHLNYFLRNKRTTVNFHREQGNMHPPGGPSLAAEGKLKNASNVLLTYKLSDLSSNLHLSWSVANPVLEVQNCQLFTFMDKAYVRRALAGSRGQHIAILSWVLRLSIISLFLTTRLLISRFFFCTKRIKRNSSDVQLCRVFFPVVFASGSSTCGGNFNKRAFVNSISHEVICNPCNIV